MLVLNLLNRFLVSYAFLDIPHFRSSAAKRAPYTESLFPVVACCIAHLFILLTNLVLLCINPQSAVDLRAHHPNEVQKGHACIPSAVGDC